MTIGTPDLWSDVFPDSLVPQILDLVWTTWAKFAKPKPEDLEVPITRLFKRDLKQEKDFRRLPIRIEREPSEDDPTTGEELGRIDLKLSPAGSALEEVYFAFECKRLYALVNGKRVSLTSQYVVEGMLRFATGQYASRMRHGGMIGYVLDGNTARARKQVGANIAAQCQALRMATPARLESSTLMANNPDICETVHDLVGNREFRLHHLFLPGSTPAPPVKKGKRKKK